MHQFGNAHRHKFEFPNGTISICMRKGGRERLMNSENKGINFDKDMSTLFLTPDLTYGKKG